MRFGKGYLFSQKWISDGGGRESTADWSTPQCEPLSVFKKARKAWATYFVKTGALQRFARLLRRNEAKDLYPKKDHPKEGCPFSEEEINHCKHMLCDLLEAETGRPVCLAQHKGQPFDLGVGGLCRALRRSW